MVGLIYSLTTKVYCTTGTPLGVKLQQLPPPPLPPYIPILYPAVYWRKYTLITQIWKTKFATMLDAKKDTGLCGSWDKLEQILVYQYGAWLKISYIFFTL